MNDHILTWFRLYIVVRICWQNSKGRNPPIGRFLPPDAMHKRSLCRHAVSFRPSVTFVDHVKTNKHIFKIFSPSRSHILIFPYQTGWRYSDGNSPNRGVDCKGGMKKSPFTISFHVVYALHCEIKSGVNTTKNVNEYNNVRYEIRFLY